LESMCMHCQFRKWEIVSASGVDGNLILLVATDTHVVIIRNNTTL